MNPANMLDWQFLVNAAGAYGPVFVGLLALINLILLLLIIVERRTHRKFRLRHLELLQGLHTANVEELVIKHRQEVAEALKRLERLEKRIPLVEQQLAQAIQKVGMVRYNAFPGLGSDQSFSLALLDSRDDGVVITSIYGREDSRFYAKPVKGGRSRYRLTDEELLALDRAKGDSAMGGLLAAVGEEDFRG